MSGSVNTTQFAKLQTLLKIVVDNVHISNSNGARFIVFAFDHNTNGIASSFSDRVVRFRNLIKTQVDRLQFTAGATIITTAIEEAKNLLVTSTRSGAQRVVVFVTDGVNFGGTDSLRLPAQDLRNVSISVKKLSVQVVLL